MKVVIDTNVFISAAWRGRDSDVVIDLSRCSNAWKGAKGKLPPVLANIICPSIWILAVNFAGKEIKDADR